MMDRGRKAFEKFLPAQTFNFWCHVTEGSLATLSGDLVSMGVILPVLAAALGASPSTLGVLTSVAGFAALSPFLFAPRMEAARRKKRLVLLLGVGMRVPLLFVAVVLLFFGFSAPTFCLIAVAASYLVMMVAVNLTAAPWMDLLAETIPESRLGHLMGYRHGFSAVIGLFLAGPACAAIVAAFGFPSNYALLYLVSFGAGTLSWLIFSLVEEIPDAGLRGERAPAREYFKNLLAAFRSDSAYAHYLVYRMVNRLGLAAMPFYTLAAVDYHGVVKAVAAGAFTAAGAAGKIGGNFIFPRIAGKLGHKRVLGIGAVFHAMAAFMAAFAPSGMWFVAVLFLWGLGMAGQTVSDPPFLVSVAPRGRRVGYISFSMLALAPVGIAAAFLAGIMMDAFGHTALFSIAGAAMFLALWPLEAVRPLARRSLVENTQSNSNGGTAK